MSEKKYIGYQGNSDLPFKQGQKVRIPKGTYVKSTNPKHLTPEGRYGGYTLKKSQMVTIHHFLSGQTIDEAHYQKEYARIYPNAPEVSGPFPGQWRATTNPCVVWAGSGGYWQEVDINDILEANK